MISEHNNSSPEIPTRKLSERDSKILLDLLSNPPDPNESLKRAAARLKEFEDGGDKTELV